MQSETQEGAPEAAETLTEADSPPPSPRLKPGLGDIGGFEDLGASPSAAADASNERIASDADSAPQDDASPAGELAVIAPADDAAPLITGPAPFLWTAVASFLLITVGILFLMMRGRARRTRELARTEAALFKPAGERAEADFDADGFERAEPAFVGHEAENVERDDDYADEAYDDEQAYDDHDDALPAPSNDDYPVEPPRSRAPFSGLFSRTHKRVDARGAEPMIDDETPVGEEAEVAFIREEPTHESAPGFAMRAYDDGADDLELEDARRRAEYDAAEIRRRAQDDARAMREQALRDAEDQEAARYEEERAFDAQRREETRRAQALLDDERRARESADAERRAAESRLEETRRRFEARENAFRSETSALETTIMRRLDDRMGTLLADLDHKLDQKFTHHLVETPMALAAAPAGGVDADQISRTLVTVEEALVALGESMKADTRNLFDGFARDVETKIARLEQRVNGGGVAGEAATGLTAQLASDLAEHRTAIEALRDEMRTKLDGFGDAPGELKSLRQALLGGRGAAGGRVYAPTAPAVQLADIVKTALPAEIYEFGGRLSNNRRADCLVRLPYPPGPIAIDAQFPVEAFNRLHADDLSEVDRKTAEKEFRRVALRHIVDVAERLVTPDDTADSALMFIPSETMFSDLHARFPDIIQDGYRARVWAVSPTSLMATLHTMRAVLRDADARENASQLTAEAGQVLEEVDSLRQRVTTLETNFDRARRDVAEVALSADQVYRRAETITETGRTLADDDRRRATGAPRQSDASTAASGPTKPTSAKPRVRGEADTLTPSDAPLREEMLSDGAGGQAPDKWGSTLTRQLFRPDADPTATKPTSSNDA